jgi:mRNA interferase RelE/StbE
MASYEINWKRSAAKDLRKLPKETIPRIVDAVTALADNPFPPGVRKLVGAESTYRIREGVYRIIYTVMTEVLMVEVLRVGHRKDVYRE